MQAKALTSLKQFYYHDNSHSLSQYCVQSYDYLVCMGTAFGCSTGFKLYDLPKKCFTDFATSAYTH